MRVLILSGYTHPSHHRKVELLADSPSVEILHILQPGNGKATGVYPSANGKRTYHVRVVPIRSVGAAGDPHRTIHWPPDFAMLEFSPHIIHCEHEQESLMAVEVALARNGWASKAKLVLYTWQNILRKRSLPVRMLSSYTLSQAQHIIGASEEAVKVVERQGYRGGTSVMPLFGLDTRYFYPQRIRQLREQLGLSQFVIGYIGRLVSEKGVDLLLQAVAILQIAVQVLIVGDGSERLTLEKLAEQLGIRQQCVFVNAVAYDQMNDYINALDLLVLPSRTTSNWKEQFGRVLVEAMACQVNVIGSDSGAISEVIDEPECIFPEGHSRALARLIESFVSAPAKRAALAQRGYQRVIKRYSVERLADDISAVWTNLAARTV